MYPLSSIDDLFDQFRDTKVFLKLTWVRCHQPQIKEVDIHKATFRRSYQR